MTGYAEYAACSNVVGIQIIDFSRVSTRELHQMLWCTMPKLILIRAPSRPKALFQSPEFSKHDRVAPKAGRPHVGSKWQSEAKQPSDE